VISWVPVTEFPAASVAAQVSKVSPTGKSEPAGRPDTLIVAVPQLSVAMASPISSARRTSAQAWVPGPVVAATSAGRVSAGGSLSVIVRIWIAVAE
jgi:hypothetical protein